MGGGAERVLLALHELFPDAPLYTSVYNPKTAPWAKIFPEVISSFLQKIPGTKTRHELFAPLMPIVFESFDFSGFDLVISITSESAKGIITKFPTRHICYMLTPTRYLWSGQVEYFNNWLRRILAYPFIYYLKSWDIVASCRPEIIISISDTVRDRVLKYYNRNSDVIYPPVDVEKFKTKIPKYKIVSRGLPYGEYFLIVSRLVKYKKIDLAILACNQLNIPLVIVGTGRDKSRLISLSGSTINFAGQVSERELLYYYQGCKALIFPQEEDFGITSVEAQASGRPVIAYAKGGATETVIDRKTGLLFKNQNVESLIDAIKEFDNLNLKEEDCVKSAERFNSKKFIKSFTSLVHKRNTIVNLLSDLK